MNKLVIMRSFACAFLILLTISFSSALGITPAIIEYNFEPGRVDTFNLHIYSGKRMINVYPEGELAKYVTLSQTTLDRGGDVLVTLTMPEKMETPGRNKFYIVAEEAAPQDQFVGTSVRVKATIAIWVPYPGKYIDSSLSIPNVNVGERIPVELKVINRGTENLTIDSTIEITRGDGSIIEPARMDFDSVELNTANEYNFRRFLDSSILGPSGEGDYIAQARIDYSGLKKQVNATFRVGSLDITITNTTSMIKRENINPFFIDVKSNWNGKIEEVYADVKIYKGNYSLAFRTPPVDIDPWGEKRITGYFDGSALKNGEYDVEIKINYAGKIYYAARKLTVSGASGFERWGIIAGIIISLLIVSAAVRFIFKKHMKGRKRRR